MNKKELARFRKVLLEKKNQLLELLKKKDIDLTENEVSEDDKVESSIEKNIFFSVSSNEAQIIHEIDRALKRIDSGNYGNCELCSKKIADKRLHSMPWVRYCITCQKNSEKAGKRI